MSIYYDQWLLLYHCCPSPSLNARHGLEMWKTGEAVAERRCRGNSPQDPTIFEEIEDLRSLLNVVEGIKKPAFFLVEDHIWWILMVFWMLWTIPNQKKSAPSLWGENEMKPFKTEPSILEKVQDLEAKPETGMMQSSPSPAISWSKTHWTY